MLRIFIGSELTFLSVMHTKRSGIVQLVKLRDSFRVVLQITGDWVPCSHLLVLKISTKGRWVSSHHKILSIFLPIMVHVRAIV